MSDKFMSALGDYAENKESVTENGAIGFATTSNYLVDLNFLTSSLRAMGESAIINKFRAAYDQNREYSILWLFMLRDVRDGMGERRTFRILIKWLADEDPSLVAKFIPYIAEYGRYDDLFSLLDTKVSDQVVKYIVDLFTEDAKKIASNSGNVSLLAKWMPSINTSSADTRKLAHRFVKAMGITVREYRKMLSAMRSKLNVLEKTISANDWNKVVYEHVPSRANLKYKDAFVKHDSVRRTEYLAKLSTGEAKINSSVNTPPEIVYSYIKHGTRNTDTVHEGLWNNLKDITLADKKLITVLDVSGSMTWYTCNSSTNMRPLDVGIGLALYTAEHLTGPFKNKCISFSNRPEFCDMSHCNSLASKINKVCSMGVGGSTNIEATMQLILDIAKKNKLDQKDIPDILIISDMEFNSCASCGSSYFGHNASENSLFSHISKKYAASGYKLPRVIFWNVHSRTETIPMKENDNGVALVSGYSQNTLRLVMSNKLDPWSVLKESLDNARYDAIRQLI